jgi:acylphosphatase
MRMKKRAEIIINGLVQGVGFRYFILRHAQELGLTGFTRNLYSGEVQTVVEGEVAKIEELFSIVKTGPRSSSVNKSTIFWSDSKEEFSSFQIRQ